MYRKVHTLFSVSKNLVEFRPAGRNKMEIHFIRRLCRPEKYISPRKCGICAPKAHKLCAQSRRRPFCQQPLSGSCYSICFLKPVLWAVDPSALLAGSCVVAPAFVISYKFEKNFWKRSYKLWDLGSESHDDELRYCGGGSGGDDSHFCGAADDGIRSCRRAVRPCGSRSRSRGRRRQACSPGQISLCRRSRSSGSRGGTGRA